MVTNTILQLAFTSRVRYKLCRVSRDKAREQHHIHLNSKSHYSSAKMSDDEQFDKEFEAEMQDLSSTLDSAIVLLRNEYKRHQEEEQNHVQALNEGEQIRELKEQEHEHVQELEKSKQYLEEQGELLSRLISSRIPIDPRKAESVSGKFVGQSALSIPCTVDFRAVRKSSVEVDVARIEDCTQFVWPVGDGGDLYCL